MSQKAPSLVNDKGIGQLPLPEVGDVTEEVSDGHVYTDHALEGATGQNGQADRGNQPCMKTSLV